MERKIYHGGAQIVRSPRFGEGRPYNDFGIGFYCTEYHACAAGWAVSRESSGFISAYSINYDGLRIINLCGSQYTPLHWLWFLLSFREFDMSTRTSHRVREYINRHFAVDHQGCDCIAGWRADNHLFALVQDFLDGKLSYQALKAALYSDDSNRQFVLKSNRAFGRLSFTGYEPAHFEDHYPDKAARELRSLKAALNTKSDSAGLLFADDLISQEVSPYDTRL